MQSTQGSRALRKVGLLARHFHHGQPRGALAPVPAQPAAQGGLMSFLFPKKSVPPPSMLEPFPNVPQAPKVPEVGLAAPQTAVTRLDNGLYIASQDMVGSSATVGIYINSGSVWEDPQTSGASNLLERMGFKSTANRTHFRLVREMEAIGAMCLSAASREQMAYTADVIKAYVPEAVELLADNVRNSLFNDWEVQEQAQRLHTDLANLQSTNLGALLQEALHSAAFVGALGNPLMASPAALARLNGQALFDFVAENYKAPRIVVAAAGVPHEEFRETVEPLFCDMPPAAPLAQPPSKYIGGDFRMAADSPATHVALGFEFAGGWKNEKESIAMVVLQALMGGGLSFSAGGPGKGMYSRLYLRVLNQNADAQSCSFFTSIFNDTGLVGIQASSKSSFVPKLVEIMVRELIAVASPGGVTAQELQRAKNATVASVLMNLESRAVVCEDIGRQILTYGERKSPESFISVVNSLTPKDITDLARKTIQTPLTFAAYGDVVHVPRFDQVAACFS